MTTMHHEPLKNVKNRRIVGGPRHGDVTCADVVYDKIEHIGMVLFDVYARVGDAVEYLGVSPYPGPVKQDGRDVFVILETTL